MKFILTCLIGLTLTNLVAQDLIAENKKWRQQSNSEFANPDTSPLNEKDVKSFDSLPYFPIDTNYAVYATMELTPESKPFKMKTSTDRLADYRQYGIARFEIEGKKLELRVYQNLRLLNKEEYKDYLFIPFMDLTNDIETYPGGRYVEATKNDSDTLFIDFNKAYNPYCAYSDRYSCPIPPSENFLNQRIEAGVLYHHKEKKKKKRKKKKKAKA